MPVIMVVLWAGFGVVWDLGMLGYISMETEEVCNLFLDFTAKVIACQMCCIPRFGTHVPLHAVGNAEPTAAHDCMKI